MAVAAGRSRRWLKASTWCAALADPVGRVTESWTRPNGMTIRGRVKVPLGVVGVIYESRRTSPPRRGLTLKAGNAVILRAARQPSARRAPSMPPHQRAARSQSAGGRDSLVPRAATAPPSYAAALDAHSRRHRARGRQSLVRAYRRSRGCRCSRISRASVIVIRRQGSGARHGQDHRDERQAAGALGVCGAAETLLVDRCRSRHAFAAAYRPCCSTPAARMLRDVRRAEGRYARETRQRAGLVTEYVDKITPPAWSIGG